MYAIRSYYAQMVVQGAAAFTFVGDNHFTVMTGQQPDGCCIDRRIQHLLRTAGEHRHPVFPSTFSRVNLVADANRQGSRLLRDQLEHWLYRFGQQAFDRFEQTCSFQSRAEA